MSDKKTVDQYLNELKYDNLLNYMPSQFALDFVSLIKLIEGGEAENKTPPVHYKIIDSFVADNGLDTINMCHRGMAKAISVDSQIITPKGNVRLADLQVGDTIYNRFGSTTEVIAKSDVFMKPMYLMTLEDGRELKVSEDHLNIVMKRRTVDAKRTKMYREMVLTTKELVESGVVYERDGEGHTKGYESKWYIPTCDAVELPMYPTTRKVSFYDVGLLLSKGEVNEHGYYLNLPYKYKNDVLSKTKLELTESQYQSYGSKRYKIENPSKLIISILEEGRVPQEYLWGSVRQRRELLKGFMDSSGVVKYGTAYCTIGFAGLANDVIWLCRSLGFEVHSKQVYTGFYNETRVYIHSDCDLFTITAKNKQVTKKKRGFVGIKSIELIKREPSQCIAVACPSKSFLAEEFFVTHNTTLKEYLIFYIAIYNKLPGFGDVPYALYVSDSIDNGVKRMRKSLELRYENSPFLQKYIKEAKFTDIRWEFVNINGKRFVLSGHGASTGVRGTRENNSRPVLALLDDLLSDTDAKSPTVIQNVEDTVYKAIDMALHPSRRKVIWSGTPFNAKDPLYKAAESGAWNVNVYPVCEVFPCSKTDFRGSWEDRFTYEAVLRAYTKARDAGKIDAFNQELMLRIMSDEERLILDTDIEWYSRANLMASKSAYNFYITTDFATSGTQASDFSVISVWALNSEGQWFWVDGVVARQTMDKNLNDLFRLAQKYKPLEVGIEVSGQQEGFIPIIKEKMIKLNIFFNLASSNNGNRAGIRPVTNKMQRFNVVVPWFKAHAMFFPYELKEDPRIVEFMQELSLATLSAFKSKNDDCIDTISMLALLNYFKPTISPSMVKDSDSGIYYDEDDEESDDSSLSNYIV